MLPAMQYSKEALMSVLFAMMAEDFQFIPSIQIDAMCGS